MTGYRGYTNTVTTARLSRAAVCLVCAVGRCVVQASGAFLRVHRGVMVWLSLRLLFSVADQRSYARTRRSMNQTVSSNCETANFPKARVESEPVCLTGGEASLVGLAS